MWVLGTSTAVCPVVVGCGHGSDPATGAAVASSTGVSTLMTNEELFDAYRQVVSERDQLRQAGDAMWQI